MLDYFVGRKEELEDLEKLFNFNQKNNKSILIGVDGIRKVGKTTFVNQFISVNSTKKDLKMFFTGDLNAPKYKNILHVISKIKFFMQEAYAENEKSNLFKENFNNYYSLYDKKYSWGNVFEFLYINLLMFKKDFPQSNIFIFFDEISWYDHQSDFISEFGRFWNIEGHKLSNLNVFMASSVSIWANEKAFLNKGSLFERFNAIIRLKPFSLKEIKQFINKQNAKIPDEHIVYYYFIFGGIIKYYLNSSWIDFKLGFEENLLQIANRKDLQEEYNNLFNGILSEKRNYKEIINVICSSKNISTKNIYNKMLKKNYKFSYQNLTNQLSDLEKYEFITKTTQYGETYYQINHLFSFFMYYWIDSGRNKINQLSNLDQDFSSWKGSALEIFLYNNIDFFISHLELESNIKYKSILNWLEIREKKGKKTIKAQVDLLIDETDLFKRLRSNKDKHLIVVECKNYDETRKTLPIQQIENIENKNMEIEYHYQSRKFQNINIKNIVFSIFPLKFPNNNLNIRNINLLELI